MSDRFSIFPCTFNNGSNNDLTQMESFRISPNANVSSIIPGGALDRAHNGLASANSMASFVTRDILGVFGFVSATAGVACSGGATFRLQKRVDGSAFATGTAHETHTSAKGFLRPVSLSASQDSTEGASLSMEYYALWNGSVDPFVQNSAVNLSTAPQPAFSSRYFLGPVYHNGTIIDSLVSWSCQFGINYSPRAFNGETHARVGSITTRTPVLQLTTTDMNEGSGLNMFINAVSTAMDFYLQAGASATDRVAAGTAGHFRLTVSAGTFSPDEVSVQGNDDGTLTYTLMPTGTISMATNSTIPKT